MRRRSVILPESSEDEEAAAAESLNIETVEIEISDDDEFVDAEEYHSPPQQEERGGNQRMSGGIQQGGLMDMDYGSFGRVEEFLNSLGVRPRREWLESCIEMLRNSRAGFANMVVAQQAELCLSEFLFADMNTAGDAVLPPNLHTCHAQEIPGPYVLQVDEIVNLSSPLRERYKETPAGCRRCLKLCITDGVQRIFGIEYRPIKDLMVLSPAGLKIALRNVHIRRGLLFLVPEVVDILGGVVENLEAAHQRLVQEVNKPPRGRRNRRGEEVLCLASRALAAAWPSASSSNTSVANGAVSGEPPPMQSSIREAAVIPTSGDTHEMHPIEHIPTSSSRLNGQRNEPVNTSMNLDRLDLEDEIDHPLLQSEESEIPFTYLACLKARKELEPVVQGRIQCILTGVKEFQFKERDKFNLFVYVDDGSLISEVLIDHQVVQSIIGHSPRQVTALLMSGDQQSVHAIKETMKQFQLFLKMFEGQMLVEINNQFVVPIVLQMTEGCQTSDAWLLLHRVKWSIVNSTSTQNPLTIDISP